MNDGRFPSARSIKISGEYSAWKSTVSLMENDQLGRNWINHRLMDVTNDIVVVQGIILAHRFVVASVYGLEGRSSVICK